MRPLRLLRAPVPLVPLASVSNGPLDAVSFPRPGIPRCANLGAGTDRDRLVARRDDRAATITASRPSPAIGSGSFAVWTTDAGSCTERLNSRMNLKYAELHAKTNFSFLEGASHPDELVRRAAELGYAALAITDRNSLAGVVRAHVAAKEAG